MGPQSARSYPGRRVVKPAPPKAQRAKQEIDYGRRGKGYVFGAFRPATGEAFTAPYAGRTTANWVDCESAWNKDPVFGVIGIQTGPRGRRVHNGSHGGHGSRFWDADSGDDCEDPAGLFFPGEADQRDLPRGSGIAGGFGERDPGAGGRGP